MSAAYWFLAFALFSSLITLVASLSIRRPPPVLIIPLFLFGLLTSELTWFFLGLQLLIAGVFLAAGALESSVGVFALLLLGLSWWGMWRLQEQAKAADGVLGRALREGLGELHRDVIPARRQAVLRDDIVPAEWMRSVSMHREGVERLEDIAYGDAGERNLLDIYRPLQPREGGLPILLQIHGGGWYMGHKQQQALPLMYHMAARGWLCVSINYRLSPTDTFPAHIVDVKKAILWIKQHIADYAGNAEFIAVTGGSAGGHLAALTALSANDPVYQPGFEDADTTVQAAVPLYGVYDFLDHSGENLNVALREHLAEKIMPCSPSGDLHLWQQASPVVRVHQDAPPFFVIHGASDVMTAWEEARRFVTALRGVSRQVVAHAELPGCQHGFDGMHSIRTDYVLNHVAEFLEWAHASEAGTAQVESA